MAHVLWISVVVLAVACIVVYLCAWRVRAAAGEALKRAIDSEYRSSGMFHASIVPQFLMNIDTGNYVEVNRAYEELTGFSRGELIGHNNVELRLIDPDVRTEVHRRLREHGHVRDCETKMYRKAGDVRDIVVAMDSVVVDGKPHAFVVLTDVTKLKRAELAAADSERRFHEIAHVSDDVFWMTDATWQHTLYVSPSYERIFGRSRETAYQAPGWLAAVHPEDRDRLEARLRSSDPIPAGRETEFRIVRPDGTIRWISDRAFPIHDERGVLTRIAGTASDITERRSLEEQLRQTQKLESLGLLAGGVAHDFNNMLAVISSCSSLLADSIPAASPDRELVDDIEGAVTRATSLTRQLLAFSRKQIVEPHVLDLNAVVKDTFKMLRRMVGDDIIVSTSLEPDLPRVFVDPGNLVQVLLNLAVNARDAMPRGGSLELRTRSHGDEVELLVADSGMGMSEEIKDHVFEPFFTTKPRGKGTGMGLAVVHGIVDQAGGRIEVDTTVGEGTTFRIFLPVSRRAQDALPESPVVVEAGIETILLVDDDEYLRRSAARALRSRGYTVLEAGSGEAALRTFQQRDDIHLLLTDVVMPGMDGRELAESIRARRPGAKVLYMSGYTDDAVVRHGVSQGEAILIEKPFRIRALAGKIREVLDA